MRSPKWTAIKSISALVVLLGASAALAKPWAEHVTHLAALSKTIESNESEIRSLIEQKKHIEDEEQIGQIMKQIGEKHKALQKATVEYEEERQHVRFEHPDKNDQLEHKYVRHDLKSVSELEHEMGLDGRLDQVRSKVLATFPLPPTKSLADKAKIESRRPASADDDDAPEKINLVK